MIGFCSRSGEDPCAHTAARRTSAGLPPLRFPTPLAGEAEAAHEMGDCTKPAGKQRSLACRACHRELQRRGSADRNAARMERSTRPDPNGGRAVLPHWGTCARVSCPPHRSCIVLRRVNGTPRPQRGETATPTRHSLRLKTAAPRRRPEGIRFWARRSWIHSRGSVSIAP